MFVKLYTTKAPVFTTRTNMTNMTVNGNAEIHVNAKNGVPIYALTLGLVSLLRQRKTPLDNRPFSWWHHLITTLRIYFVFPFKSQLEVLGITVALIILRKQNSLIILVGLSKKWPIILIASLPPQNALMRIWRPTQIDTVAAKVAS